jgi:hypothetical protein
LNLVIIPLPGGLRLMVRWMFYHAAWYKFTTIQCSVKMSCFIISDVLTKKYPAP